MTESRGIPFGLRDPVDLEGFLTIFTFAKKRDLEKYSRTTILHGRDLVHAICACDNGILPFKHRAVFRRIIPEDVILTRANHLAIQGNGVGPLNPQARKAVRRLFQLIEVQRHLAGHLFYVPNSSEWHFLYFDQRDVEAARRNHWEHGPHVHFINWLWPTCNPHQLWAEFQRGKPSRTDALHFRYVEREECA